MKVFEKSQSYRTAAQRLIDAKTHPHCSIVYSYFYVYEYMKFLLANRNKDAVLYQDQDYPGEDSHLKIRDAVFAKITNKEANNTQKKISDLHDIRVAAEYSIKQYTNEEALDTLEKAIELQKKLKYYYNNLLPDNLK